MKIHISNGNMKLGNIPNISLPPIISCPPNIPCIKDCYAQKAYRLYPNVKESWDENLRVFLFSPDLYFNAIIEDLVDRNNKYFRWHVSGDIINQEYLNGMIEVAKKVDMKFMAMTKNKELDFDNLPTNLNILFSTWEGYDIDKDMPKTGIRYKKDKNRRIMCPGSCKKCKKCWTLQPGEKIYFKKH